MKTQRAEEIFGSHSYSTFGMHVALRAARTLPAKEISWHSFMLETDWTPRLLIADRRNRLLEISKNHPGILIWNRHLEYLCKQNVY
jgi:hypothetical protein